MRSLLCASSGLEPTVCLPHGLLEGKWHKALRMANSQTMIRMGVQLLSRQQDHRPHTYEAGARRSEARNEANPVVNL